MYILFKDIEKDIKTKLREKQNLNITEPTELVEGFFHFSGNYGYDVYHKPANLFNLPSIAIVGRDSGRLYFFSLKKLFTDEELKKYQ